MRSLKFVPLAAIVVLSGCPMPEARSDSGPASFPDCGAIIEACHDVEPGSGAAHDCHELAHDAASNDPCVAPRAMCVALCAAIDGGVADEDVGTAP